MPKNRNEFINSELIKILNGVLKYDKLVKIADTTEPEPIPTLTAQVFSETFEFEETATGRAIMTTGTSAFGIHFQYPIKDSKDKAAVLNSIIYQWADILQTNVERLSERNSFTYEDKTNNIFYRLNIKDYRITNITHAKDLSATPRAFILLSGQVKFTMNYLSGVQ